MMIAKNILAIISGCAMVTFVFLLFLNKFPPPLAVIVAPFVVAFLHSVFLGLPLYVLLPWRFKKKWFVAAIAGFVIGVVPNMLITYDIEDMRTPDKWLEFGQTTLATGGLGILGAMTSWIVWQLLVKSPQTADSVKIYNTEFKKDLSD